MKDEDERSAQQEMEAARNRYFDLYDRAPVGYVTLSENGMIMEANLSAATMLGVTKSALIKHPLSGFIISEDQEIFHRHRKQLFETHPTDSGQASTSHAFELRMVKKDNAQCWMRLDVTIARNNDGESVARAVMIDITAYKQKEDTLRKLSRAVEQSPATVVVTDLKGTIEYVNPQFSRSTGYTQEEVLGKNPRVLKSGRQTTAYYQELWDTILSGSVWRGEFYNKRKNGDIFWERASISPINNEKGEVTHFVAVKEDITESKQVEEALQDSEKKFRAISVAAQDGIIMMDNDGLVTFWNPGAERILGYANDEVIGRSLHLIVAPDNYHEAYFNAFPLWQASGKGQAIGQVTELRARKKDGTDIFVDLSISSVMLENKWHAVGIVRDITKRKQAEEKLLESNHKLIQANERANELAIKADIANRAKSEFLANMSHEIRTPMNGVIGMTGLLLDTELNEEQRKHANIVRTCGEALLRLINDILDFSKIEAGKLELETLDFDLRALLDDFAALMAERVQKKGLEFICAAAADVPTYLRGDPGRLRQILVNLTGNAMKFTRKGEIAVRVNLLSETEEEAVVRFSVIDTGIGIPVDKKELLFQKFTQVDASTTRHYGGTGLGLAISKQLAEMMGGAIGVESEEGKGSEFWFTVQLGKQPRRERTEEIPSAGIRGAHILVVDDNATNREVLAAQFRAWGVRSEDVPDAPLALQALYRARDAGDPFQVAILDMQMPGVDGAALGRAIKIDEKLKKIRLVMMTSLGRRGDARLMEEIGFAAYLIKPVRQADLFEALSVVLAAESLPRAVQPLVTRHSIRELRRGAVRILLAEDDITNQEVALGILKKLGLRADVVANGAEAVKALENPIYDLVLMDVQMPEMDGFTATRIIRDPQSAVRNHHIPVIAMTAYAMTGDREKCVKAGMNDYVSKPVEPQSLVDVLEKWLPQDNAGTQERASDKAQWVSPFSGPEMEVQIFDKAGVMVRLMNDEDLARKVFGSFLDNIPKQIDVLREYVKSGSTSSAERQAHTIKGASATCGGDALSAVALKMEDAGRAGDMESVAAYLPELELQFIRLKFALNEFINRK